MSSSEVDVQAEHRIAERKWSVELGALAAASVGAGLVALWIFRDALGSLNETWGGGDSPAIYMHAKALLDHFWVTPVPDLGWPYGLDLAAFPVPYVQPLLALKLLALTTRDPVAAVNLYFLVSYPAAAATGYLLLRWAGVARVIAVMLAIGFATVPWHAERFHHLFFAAYTIIPVAAFLASLPACRRDRIDALARRPWVLWTVIALASISVGFSGVYAGIFCLVLLGVVLVARWLTSGVDMPRLRASAAAICGVVVGLLVTLAITRYLDASPAAAAISAREASDAYLYGGDLLSLLLPSDLTSLSHLLPERFVHGTATIGDVAINEGDGLASPLVAIACSLALLVAIGTSLGGRTRRVLTIVGPWAGILVALTLAFVIGGLGALIAQIGLPQIRSWGRLSIWIILIALVVLGLLMTAIASRSRHRKSVAAVVCAVLAVLVLDQATQANPNPPNTGQRSGLEGIGTYADAVLGPTCPIFTYPSKEFPESGQVNDMIDYAHFYPYLYLGEHPISYGSVKGTTEDLWQRQLPPDSAGLAQVVAAMGFCGILVDSAYWSAADRQPQLQAWMQALGEPKASALDRWYLFPLRAASATDAAGARARWDVVGVPTNATTGADYAVGAISWWHGTSDLDLTLVNNTQEPRRGLVTVDVAAAPCLPGPITVDAPGAEPASLELAPGQRATIGYRVDLAGDGYRDVPVRINGSACQVPGDPRPLLLQVFVGGLQPD